MIQNLNVIFFHLSRRNCDSYWNHRIDRQRHLSMSVINMRFCTTLRRWIQIYRCYSESLELWIKELQRSSVIYAILCSILMKRIEWNLTHWISSKVARERERVREKKRERERCTFQLLAIRAAIYVVAIIVCVQVWGCVSVCGVRDYLDYSSQSCAYEVYISK